MLAWQIYGTKHFCGLTDPDRWAPREMRLNYNPSEFAKPEALTDADALCYTMRPGDALWNVQLTGLTGKIAFNKVGQAGKESAQSTHQVHLVKVDEGKIALVK